MSDAELRRLGAEMRLLGVAIEFLRRDMADLPLAIVQNLQSPPAGPPPKPTATSGPASRSPTSGRDAAGGVAAGLGALALSFGKLLGPLAALSTFLSASTSGFAVFNKAIQLFATTLAPLLLPPFFLLAVALAATSEALFAELAPALEGMFAVILNYGIPTITFFVDMIASAAEALKKMSEMDLGIGGVKGGDLTAALGLLSPGTMVTSGMYLADRLSGGSGDGRAYGESVGGGTGAKARGATGRALADTLAELRLSTGPQASSGSITSVYSRAQMASLSQSPFERRMLEMMEKVVGSISRAAIEPGRGLTTPPAPAVPARR